MASGDLPGVILLTEPFRCVPRSPLASDPAVTVNICALSSPLDTLARHLIDGKQ